MITRSSWSYKPDASVPPPSYAGGAAMASSAAGGGGGVGASGLTFSGLDEAAVPFITVDEADKFHVNPEAVAYLKTLTGKVAVVAIAGVYRTGKSYLLNQLMGRPNGFTVGPTVKACTKGLWLWGKAIEVDGGDMHILFLDTEGLGSTIRSETYDSRIFALALLLSSYFIYNSVGTIDGAAVSKLSLVVNLTKHIHVRAQSSREDSGTEYNQFFPHFLWVVRDFTVKLEREGRKISSRDYLEDALKPEEGVSEATEQKNAVRMLLRNFFPERDCVTVVRPVSDEAKLMNLPAVPPEQLRPEFRAQIDAMRKRVLSTARPKTVYGKQLNGAMLAALAEAYVAAINTGGTPTISTAWDRVVDSQCADAVEGAVDAYVSAMHAALASAAASRKPPAGGAAEAAAGPAPSPLFSTVRASATYAAESTIVEDEEMHAAHAAASQAAVAFFQSRAVQDADKTPPFEMRLRAELEAAHSRLRAANEAASSAFCLELLERLQELATSRVASLRRSAGGAPITEDGTGVITAAAVAAVYREATDVVHQHYTAEARGPGKTRALADFLLTRLPRTLAEAAAVADESRGAQVAALDAHIAALGQDVAAARGRERAAAESLAQERRGFEAALGEQTRAGAAAVERLKSELESRSGELERLSARYDKLLAASEAQSVRADEAAAAARADLSAAHARIDELQTTHVGGLIEAAVLSQRLAEAEAARGALERQAAELRLAVAEEARAAAVLAVRTQAAENETVRLRENTELLYESVRVQKDLLAAKNDEKEECEYQWGVAKAKLAQVESERLTLETDLSVLTSVAAKLKAAAARAQPKGAVKLPAFDRVEQRVYEGLEGGGAAAAAAAGGAGGGGGAHA